MTGLARLSKFHSRKKIERHGPGHRHPPSKNRAPDMASGPNRFHEIEERWIQDEIAVTTQVISIEEQRLLSFERIAHFAWTEDRERIPHVHAWVIVLQCHYPLHDRRSPFESLRAIDLKTSIANWIARIIKIRTAKWRRSEHGHRRIDHNRNRQFVQGRKDGFCFCVGDGRPSQCALNVRIVEIVTIEHLPFVTQSIHTKGRKKNDTGHAARANNRIFTPCSTLNFSSMALYA